MKGINMKKYSFLDTGKLYITHAEYNMLCDALAYTIEQVYNNAGKINAFCPDANMETTDQLAYADSAVDLLNAMKKEFEDGARDLSVIVS